MNSVLILSKKCATGEELFSFGKKKFEKFDFRTGPKKSSNYSENFGILQKWSLAGGGYRGSLNCI